MIGRSVLKLFCVLLLGRVTDLQQTEHLASYQLTVPRPIGGRLKRDVDGTPPTHVSFMVSVDGEELVLRLQRNTKLLSHDFTVFTYGEDGTVRSSSAPAQSHCHYQGFIQDDDESSVAMSVCDGLRGVIHRSNISYGIEPLASAPEQHLLYRLQDVTSQPQGCGTPHNNNYTTKSHEYTTQQIEHNRVKRAALHKTHYVELLLVVDNDRFSFMNRNVTAVREQMVHLANYIDSIYQQLNVRVVLVALEVWTQQNLISTEGSAGDVLSRFTQWREKELSRRRRHDSAQLILKKSFGGTAGMAFVSSVCSRSHGGGINTFVNNNVQSLSSIVAHELGHNLGMTHDDQRSCSCPASLCIMHSGATGSSSFSSCSSEDLEKLLLGGARCLLNVPQPEEAYSAPYCGNRLLDTGEECDCGSQTECDDDPCCEFQTCKLKPGAQCGYGECCSKKCQFLPGGSVCRSSTDECDLPEFCNGSSSVCQSDVFVQDGAPCRNQQSFCYNGRCQHYERQCQDIFGKKAKAAPEICFKHVNSKGDRFGNCGFHSNGYKKCESRNAVCGKLQCLNVMEVTAFGVKPSVISSPIGAAQCYGVDFDLGSDVPDPGMVNEGTKCGDNKVCINFECRSADILKYDCDAQNKCHGRGVCNSNRNCHCEDDWAPPLCELRGYGGSVDSGPTWNDKDTSLRDGLLLFFFLVLPLLALGAFVFLRRDKVLRRLGLNRRKRTQRYQADANASAHTNQAPPPIVARDNSSEIRNAVVETNRTTPSYARRPPPPLKPKPAVSQPLMPQRPAPPPPV
ncbi:disintegrin and metalloproteinase domain-containing protein 9-like isoform X2 [Gouania willdenowi]|uniref:disintegrin and metalloproteinase domain-containing protein 9-like isoform X2 n=1 Tax=Gouania willdenowi TaxID=441366 RepID=UPI0010563D24|nr:disintegrin and metalloproteinase domain-containing protein 9 isoform X2 [Gouania willdenowi]